MKEILISQDFHQIRVAFVEDKRLVDYFIQRDKATVFVGNIYKGIVESIIPGMDAAFIDIGNEKRGFLHVDDIINPADDFDDDDESAKPKKRVSKDQQEKNIRKLLKEGQEVLVQVVKEPIGTKGPRLTTHITVPGRFMVLMPMETRVGVSKRIRDFKERDRLRALIKTLAIPKDMGLIVRTAAINKTKRDFARELKYGVTLWKKVAAVIPKTTAPALLHKEETIATRVVRDCLYEDVQQVVVDSKEIHKNIMQFARVLMPSARTKIKLYEDKKSLFEFWGVEREIEKIYDKYVYLKSGGSLIIEQIESLIAIDVNTGKYLGKKNLEETVYKVNLEAAIEIAHQMRLRDLGGIVIVDFIDMLSMDHRKKVLQKLHDEMQKDKAKFDILGMSELCLVEMTRQRVRKSIERQSYRSCPCCRGRGMLKTNITLAIEALKKMKQKALVAKKKSIEVTVHPEVASRLLNEERELVVELEQEVGVKIAIRPEFGCHYESITIS